MNLCLPFEGVEKDVRGMRNKDELLVLNASSSRVEFNVNSTIFNAMCAERTSSS